MVDPKIHLHHHTKIALIFLLPLWLLYYQFQVKFLVSINQILYASLNYYHFHFKFIVIRIKVVIIVPFIKTFLELVHHHTLHHHRTSFEFCSQFVNYFPKTCFTFYSFINFKIMNWINYFVICSLYLRFFS